MVAVLDAKDVPGENKSDVEEVFASKKVCIADLFTVILLSCPTCKIHGAWLILWGHADVTVHFSTLESVGSAAELNHRIQCARVWCMCRWSGGQPVGLVVAHSRAVAERAAALVKVRVVARGVLFCLVKWCMKQGFL